MVAASRRSPSKARPFGLTQPSPAGPAVTVPSSAAASANRGDAALVRARVHVAVAHGQRGDPVVGELAGRERVPLPGVVGLAAAIDAGRGAEPERAVAILRNCPRGVELGALGAEARRAIAVDDHGAVLVPAGRRPSASTAIDST